MVRPLGLVPAEGRAPHRLVARQRTRHHRVWSTASWTSSAWGLARALGGLLAARSWAPWEVWPSARLAQSPWVFLAGPWGPTSDRPLTPRLTWWGLSGKPGGRKRWKPRWQTAWLGCRRHRSRRWLPISSRLRRRRRPRPRPLRRAVGLNLVGLLPARLGRRLALKVLAGPRVRRLALGMLGRPVVREVLLAPAARLRGGVEREAEREVGAVPGLGGILLVRAVARAGKLAWAASAHRGLRLVLITQLPMWPLLWELIHLRCLPLWPRRVLQTRMIFQRQPRLWA